jgi:hypothetical protein
MPTKQAEGYSKEVYLVDAVPAGEAHLGQVGSGGIVVQVTPVCAAATYDAADVLFDVTEVAGAVRVSGGKSVLESVVVLDEDDNTAAAMTLFIMAATGTLGTANAAVSITDANARNILGVIPVGSGFFVDLIACRVACVKNIGLVVQPTTGTSVWVAAATAGTPTQTASGIKVRLGFRYL